jgi:hypothetical protein
MSLLHVPRAAVCFVWYRHRLHELPNTTNSRTFCYRSELVGCSRIYASSKTPGVSPSCFVFCRSIVTVRGGPLGPNAGHRCRARRPGWCTPLSKQLQKMRSWTARSLGTRTPASRATAGSYARGTRRLPQRPAAAAARWLPEPQRPHDRTDRQGLNVRSAGQVKHSASISPNSAFNLAGERRRMEERTRLTTPNKSTRYTHPVHPIAFRRASGIYSVYIRSANGFPA